MLVHVDDVCNGRFEEANGRFEEAKRSRSNEQKSGTIRKVSVPAIPAYGRRKYYSVGRVKNATRWRWRKSNRSACHHPIDDDEENTMGLPPRIQAAYEFVHVSLRFHFCSSRAFGPSPNGRPKEIQMS